MFEKRPTPLVSIIIPSWFTKNQRGKYGEMETFWFAVECLKRLKAVTPKEQYELIIIDNGSRLDFEDIITSENYPAKDDKELIPHHMPDVYWNQADILIRNQENLGFAPACNQGFEVARGEYIVCLNNDVLVWPGWLDALLNVFKQPLVPSVGVVMPALINGLRDAREAIKLENPDFTPHAGQYGPRAEFGSLWVIKRDLMEAIKEFNKEDVGDRKLFDENFRCGMGEDRKLWAQVRMLGYETYRCHDTRVFHQGNLTISKIDDRKQYTLPNREYLAEWKKKHNIN